MDELEFAIKRIADRKRCAEIQNIPEFDFIPRDVLLYRLSLKADNNEACQILLKRIKESTQVDFKDFVSKHKVCSLIEFIKASQNDKKSIYHIEGKEVSDFQSFVF